ncbi:RHS repeat-associated protein [Diaminobutyricimonas aerilata]|uniref:RHS repeat-associated protein n=1 Tax=Diaminobutyricimonas aerilata TaxID=1162967 RepID=A0A2M9CGB2_9MICO|nr:RHS repeat-associated core domain-containing protein [Diaminobutyricimonas aerilata]PJJ70964.1 RHS repeat-associated protein [Diaminobutyricimonas aerilata]
METNELAGISEGLRHVEYGYDGLGRALTETVDNLLILDETTTQQWDGYTVISRDSDEFGATELVRDAIGDVAIQNSDALLGEDTRWGLTDRQGSTIGQTHGSKIGQLTHYSDWGVPTFDTLGWNSETGYTGELSDTATGLVNFYARSYDPDSATWLTADPYRGDPTNPQTLHRYSYVGNNPTTLTDHLGYMHQANEMSSSRYQNYGGGNYSSTGYPSYATPYLGKAQPPREKVTPGGKPTPGPATKAKAPPKPKAKSPSTNKKHGTARHGSDGLGALLASTIAIPGGIGAIEALLGAIGAGSVAAFQTLMGWIASAGAAVAASMAPLVATLALVLSMSGDSTNARENAAGAAEAAQEGGATSPGNPNDDCPPLKQCYGDNGPVPFRKDTNHMFRDDRGHIVDSPAFRQQVQDTVKSNNYAFNKDVGTGWVDTYLRMVDGKQIWVQVFRPKNGGAPQINNAGINTGEYIIPFP